MSLEEIKKYVEKEFAALHKRIDILDPALEA